MTLTNDTREDTIDRLNRLLRGEISAVETYQQALAKVQDEPTASELRRILTDHETAVAKLRIQVSDLGGEPANSSGLWGSWAQLVEGAAKLIGPETALSALREGEKHGVSEYEASLDDANFDPKHKTLIRTELLPQSHTHIQILERHISA